jgi:hypothetical protein
MPVTPLAPAQCRRRHLLTAALASPLLALAPPARAVEPLTQHDVVLLQPGPVLERRVNADALAAWVRTVGAAATASMREHPAQLPTAGFIALVVKPGGRLRTWYDFRPPLAAETETALTQALAALPVIAVTDGPVVIGLRVSVWGAREPATHAPAPAAWRDAAKRAGHALPLDELIEAVWPG